MEERTGRAWEHRHRERTDGGGAHPRDGAHDRDRSGLHGRRRRAATGRRTYRLVVGTILVAAALKLAHTVLVPVVAGLFLAVLARPIQQRIARVLPRRLRWLGLVAAMLVVIAAVGAFGAALGLSGRAVADELRERRPRLEASLASARAQAERLGLPPTVVPTLPGGGQATRGGGGGTGGTAAGGAGAGGAGAGGAGAGERPFPGGAAEGSGPASGSATGGDATARTSTEVRGGNGSQGGGSSAGGALGALRTAASGLLSGFGGLLLALAFCALGLAETDQARRRLARAVPPDRDPPVLETVDQATRAFRQYAWVKTLTSAITGVATWLVTLAFGLPLAWVWGFLAFLLEYVPSVGSVLAVVPPTLMALAVDGPGRAALVFVAVGTLQVILGNVVDPRLEGRFMHVSPFGVLLSILVWGWLWGPVGALLAVPMTVALVIAARHIRGARGLAVLVSGESGASGERQGGDDER